MAQRRSQATRNRAAVSREKTANRAAAKAKAAKASASSGRDVTQYADKAPTAFHKFFARWIVEQVGYVPEDAKSHRAAFLAGVSIATAARQAFQASAELAEWREETGETKRGPKPKDEAEVKRRGQRQNVTDEEFEPEDEDDAEAEDSEEGTDFEELESELQEMTIGDLRKTAKEEYGLKLGPRSNKATIIKAILEAAEESEEDDEEGYDLDELQEELDDMTLADLKERAEDEFEITPKKGERKAALIARIIESLEDDEDDSAEEDEDEPEEEERPAKSRARAGGSASASGKRKAKPADDEDDDEFLF